MGSKHPMNSKKVGPMDVMKNNSEDSEKVRKNAANVHPHGPTAHILPVPRQICKKNKV